MAPILWSINTLAPSWQILYPKVLELSLRSVCFLMSLCPYAYLRVIPQRFFNNVWSRVSDDIWRVVQHLHPGPPAPYLLDCYSLSLHPFGYHLPFPCLSLGHILGVSTKPLAAGPLCWGSSNIVSLPTFPHHSCLCPSCCMSLLPRFFGWESSYHATLLTGLPDPPTRYVPCPLPATSQPSHQQLTYLWSLLQHKHMHHNCPIYCIPNKCIKCTLVFTLFMIV